METIPRLFHEQENREEIKLILIHLSCGALQQCQNISISKAIIEMNHRDTLSVDFILYILGTET